LATSIFSVTAAMVKEGRLKTAWGDSIIEAIAQKKEYWVAQKTGYSATPSDAITLANLQEMVCLYAAIHIKNSDPHSEGDGSYRYDHYPQATWMRELSEYEDEYFLKSTHDPVIWEQPVE